MRCASSDSNPNSPKDITDSSSNGIEQLTESPMVTAAAEPKTLVFDWSHIIFPKAADHYALQVSSDGGSVFTPVENAEFLKTLIFA